MRCANFCNSVLSQKCTDEEEGVVEEEEKEGKKDEDDDDEDVIIEEIPIEPREERKCPAHMYECKENSECIMIYQR